MPGEIIAWRDLFWSLSDAMASDPQPWVGDDARDCRSVLADYDATGSTGGSWLNPKG